MKLSSVKMTGDSCIRFTKLLVGWEAYFEEEIYCGCIDFNIDNDECGQCFGGGW